MHLYGALASPFVQRVLMTVRAKGRELDMYPPPGGSTRSDEFRAISPMGRVPILALDDGQHLCESHAIVCYLDETLDGPSLMPDDALARARVRELESITLFDVASGARPLMVHLVFRMSDAPEVVAAARTQLAQGLAALDRLIAARGFATGGGLTAADCILVPVLTLLRIIDPMTGAWRAVTLHTRIAEYFARMEAHAIAQRSIAEMQEGFAAILARNTAS